MHLGTRKGLIVDRNMSGESSDGCLQTDSTGFFPPVGGTQCQGDKIFKLKVKVFFLNSL